mmetsp:Transcript_20501/g.30344  ORF Transcript_20501/g.30344 Transcript_20501/m.30344 type:complete len:125 (+) Transcript_20501:17-391(+)
MNADIFLEKLFANEASMHDEAPTDPLEQKLFKNIVIYVDGYTRPLMREIKAMAEMRGGKVVNHKSSIVTHTICRGLPLTKLKKIQASGKHIPNVVVPKWFTSCIKQKRILPASDYLIPGLHPDK